MVTGEAYIQEKKRILVAVLACVFLATLGIGVISFTLPLISFDDKVSGAWLGSGFAGYFLARLLAAPIAGFWTDSAGPRRPLILATVAGAFSPLVYFIYPSIETLYAIQCVLGLVSGFTKPIGLAVLGGNVERERLAHWFAIHALLFNIAMFLGPLVGGGLYLGRDIEPVIMGLVACMVVAFCCVFFISPSGITSHREAREDESSVVTRPGEHLANLFAISGRTLGIGLMVAFYPILLSMNLGLSGLTIGLVYSVPSFAVCAVLPFAGRLCQGKSTLGVTALGMLMSAAGLFGLGLSTTLWHFVILGCVIGVGTAISIPASMAFASRFSHHQGKTFGVTQIASGVGLIIGPLLGGFIVHSFHDLGSAFCVAAIIGALCCMPLLTVVLRDRLYFGRTVSMGGPVVFSVLMVWGVLALFQPNVRTSQGGDSDLHQYTDVAMGTVVNLTLVADSSKAADDAARKALSLMRELERDLDHRDPHGSVGRINLAAGKHFIKPSERAYDLIRRTVDMSKMTGGVFDPTIGALTTSPLYYVLDETIARSKKGLVDYRLVSFDEKGKRIRLAKSGMALDLGGVAKGTIIDSAVKFLRGQGIRAGIVEAGGDFYCFGDRDWKVGIRHPRVEKVYATVTVREKGICGSGDYQQFVDFEKDGKTNLRHHIIDPTDMEPADESSGVTVIAESSERADALATTLFIMGPNKGKAFMHDKYTNASAMWFTPNLKVFFTDNFPK